MNKQKQIGAVAVIAILIFIAAIVLSQGEEDSTDADETAPIEANVVDDTQPEADSSLPTTPQLLSPDEYMADFGLETDGHLLLDVRTPEEFAQGHIPGAVNISVQTLESRLSELPQDQPIVIYCRSGNRSAQASTILDNAGFNGIYDMGGIIAWQSAGLPIQ